MWQVDCANYVSFGQPFELRKVTTGEHETFVETFAKDRNLIITKKGTTVLFEPTLKDRKP